ncbi:MAG TPA: hypothetical protein PK467_14130, partial [Candidatus Wallbacteria bacterium]|nr:hypothetical protein [Candidatus Wallbacteria bacterium]
MSIVFPEHNDDLYTNISFVDATMEVTGCMYRQISNRPDFKDASWQKMKTSDTNPISIWELSTNTVGLFNYNLNYDGYTTPYLNSAGNKVPDVYDGKKMVYARYKNGAGLMLGPVTDEITFDQTAPSTSLLGPTIDNDTKLGVNGGDLILKLTAVHDFEDGTSSVTSRTGSPEAAVIVSDKYNAEYVTEYNYPDASLRLKYYSQNTGEIEAGYYTSPVYLIGSHIKQSPLGKIRWTQLANADTSIEIWLRAIPDKGDGTPDFSNAGEWNAGGSPHSFAGSGTTEVVDWQDMLITGNTISPFDYQFVQFKVKLSTILTSGILPRIDDIELLFNRKSEMAAYDLTNDPDGSSGYFENPVIINIAKNNELDKILYRWSSLASPGAPGTFEVLNPTSLFNIDKPQYILEVNEDRPQYLQWFGVSKTGDTESVTHSKLFKFAVKGGKDAWVKILDGDAPLDDRIVTDATVTLQLNPAVLGDASMPGKIKISSNPGMIPLLDELSYTTNPFKVNVTETLKAAHGVSAAIEGRVNVYAQFESPYGETTEVVSDSIVLDLYKPNANLYKIGDSEFADYSRGGFTNVTYVDLNNDSFELKLGYKNSLVLNKYTSETGLGTNWSSPSGIAADANYIFAADGVNQKLYKINQQTLIASSSSAFVEPCGVDVDETYVYVSDKDKHSVYKLLKSNLTKVGVFGKDSLTGNGTADGELDSPEDIAIDSSRNYMYINDAGNQRIVKVSIEGMSFVASKPYDFFKIGSSPMTRISGIAAD